MPDNKDKDKDEKGRLPQPPYNHCPPRWRFTPWEELPPGIKQQLRKTTQPRRKRIQTPEDFMDPNSNRREIKAPEKKP